MCTYVQLLHAIRAAQALRFLNEVFDYFVSIHHDAENARFTRQLEFSEYLSKFDGMWTMY